ncbi:MAG: CADD family putative folate metabolism protein [Acidobacteriaceae bacterium]
MSEFVQELDACIARFDLLCHPFYQAWSEGKLTTSDLREYSAEYYHHVAAFPTYLSAFHSRLEDGELRRAVLRNLADEEIEGRAHADLWLDFAAGLGASAERVRDRQPIPEIEALINHFRSVASSATRAEVLASFYAYESQVPRVAKEKARGLRERYGADAKTCGYFTLHQFADVQHSAVWRDELERALEAHPEEREAALAAAEHAAQILWQALDGVQRQIAPVLA